jgi:multimeric flavodoxin WrbA
MNVTAIVGSYRKGGTVDTVIDAILSAAREAGAETSKIYLIDKHIEFCTNCRECTQQKGPYRGTCPLEDDMSGILATIKRSDALVLGSSINFYTVTAVMKKFAERLLCYAYWPWGMLMPKMRNKKRDKRAVVVISSAAPSIMTRFLTGAVRLMKDAAAMLGCRTIGVLVIGIAARSAKTEISPRMLKKARRLGIALAAGNHSAI